MHTWSLQELN